MRASSLPRPARAAATGLAVAAALLAVAVARADDPSSLGGEAKRLESVGADIAARSRSALLDLYALESRLTASKQRLGVLRAKATKLARAEASAKRRLRVAQHARDEAERRLGVRLRALYVEDDVDPLAVLLGAGSLSDALSALDSLDQLAEQDKAIVRQVERTTAELRASLNALRARRAELRRLISRAQAARATLAAARLERTSYLEGLAQAKRLNEREIASLIAKADEIAARSEELQGQVPAPAAASTTPAPPEAAVDHGTRTITVVATGYSLSGHTATGLPVGWGIAAVDPPVIPLGTRMTVPGYGDAVAADTGSAVQGAIIDLWFPTVAEALAWGTRTVTITLH